MFLNGNKMDKYYLTLLHNWILDTGFNQNEQRGKIIDFMWNDDRLSCGDNITGYKLD